MSGSIARVYNYYNNNCNPISRNTFKAYLNGKGCNKPIMTLYYRLNISPTDTSLNSTNTTFVTNPSNSEIYRGIENRYMVNGDFTTYNQNILTFIGYRTPGVTIGDGSLNLTIPSLYNETININIQPYDNNFITATQNYIDSGGGFETTIPFVDYVVTGASGIFAPYKNMRITFYNNGNPPGSNINLGPVRIVTLTT